MGKTTGFMDYARKTSTDVAPLERLENFNEFHIWLSREQQQTQAARCMDCGVPFCQAGMMIGGMASGCPLNNLIPEWNDLVYHGKWELAMHRLMATNLRPVFITSRQLALHRQQNGNQQCDCIINLCSTRYLHSEAGTEAYSASKGETSIIHDGLTAEDLRFIPVLFPKSALGTVSSPLCAGRRTSGNGACCSTRF